MRYLSEKRDQKDSYNREKGLLRLQKRIQSGKLTKSNINNRGYSKYLKLEREIKISIDYAKYESDAALPARLKIIFGCPLRKTGNLYFCLQL